jgi:hypothetical protein
MNGVLLVTFLVIAAVGLVCGVAVIIWLGARALR